MRIISLIASATETVCALGLAEFLVGRSHECDYPASIASLPVCTRPRFDVSGTSREIDERVKSLQRRSLVEDALGVYEVFPEHLRELKPTHIVTQAQCEVCAVSLADVERAVRDVSECDARIISLEPNSMADIWADICRVASELGATASGVRLVADLQGRVEQIESRARALTQKPRTAVIEWVEPLMAAGNWTPELVKAAGGENLFGEPGAHSPWMQFDDLVERDPDVIFIAPCGYHLERTAEDLPLLEARPRWAELSAVRRGHVYIADGNQFFNRPGPRLVKSLEILAEVLHPEVFHFGHEGVGWRRHCT